MKQKVLTGIGLFALLILMFASRMWTLYVFDVCIGIITIAAAMEFSKLMSRCGLYNYYTLAGIFPSALYLLVGLLIYAELNFVYIFVCELALAIVFMLLTLFISLFFKKNQLQEMDMRKFKKSRFNFAFRKAVYTMISFIYPAIMFTFAILANRFGALDYCFINLAKAATIDFGLVVLLVTFLIPIINDTFAQFTGMIFKGPKLIPSVSPNKTVSGFVGGVVWTTLFMACLFFIFNAIESYSIVFSALNISLLKFSLIGFFGAIVSNIGDVLESFLKRKAKVKDAGNIIPGHGGVLDRFDSHIFTAPYVFFCFFLLII